MQSYATVISNFKTFSSSKKKKKSPVPVSLFYSPTHSPLLPQPLELCCVFNYLCQTFYIYTSYIMSASTTGFFHLVYF
jgi:hypothetical protein